MFEHRRPFPFRLTWWGDRVKISYPCCVWLLIYTKLKQSVQKVLTAQMRIGNFHLVVVTQWVHP